MSEKLKQPWREGFDAELIATFYGDYYKTDLDTAARDLRKAGFRPIVVDASIVVKALATDGVDCYVLITIFEGLKNCDYSLRVKRRFINA